MEEGSLTPEADPHHGHACRDEAPSGCDSQVHVCVSPELDSTAECMYVYVYPVFLCVTKYAEMEKMCSCFNLHLSFFLN